MNRLELEGRKVAIIGKTDQKWKAPFKDDEWLIWGCNYHNDMSYIKWDLWFDIHERIHPFLLDYFNKHPDRKGDLITKDNYPIKAVLNMGMGGKNNKNFLNQSMSYMLAFAILYKVKEVMFYGCSLNHDSENRTLQKQALREMIMFARGRGLIVESYDRKLISGYNHYGAEILKSSLYNS